MKRNNFAHLLASAFVFSISAAEPEVIAIGIGEKNPTLNESLFKNTKVFYTPSIKVDEGSLQKLSYSGEPAFLAQWFNSDGAANDFLVIGSNGVVYDQGKAITAGIDMVDVETERKGSFAKSAWAVVQKDRTVGENRSPISPSEPDGFIRRKLPAFNMVTPEGTAVDSKTVLENGKPKLVIFFYLKPTTYIGGEKESGTVVRSKEYMQGRRESASGTEGVRALIQTERELFGNIIHDIY